jgi:hypothetical protein
MKKIIYILAILLLVMNVSALKLINQNCGTNGGFEITIEAEDKNMTYTDKLEVVVDGKVIEGEWNINYLKRDPPDRSRQFADFISNEAEVLGGGKKIIKINYPEMETVQGVLDCPQFLFSCALLDLNIDECYTENNTFYAYFTAKGFGQSDVLSVDDNLEFNLHTLDLYEDINDIRSNKGAKPKYSIVKQFEGDQYKMEFKFPNENNVDRFRVAIVGVNSCLTDKYEDYNLKLDDFMECSSSKQEEVVEGETPIVEDNVDEQTEEPKTEVIKDAVFEEIKENDDLTPVVIIFLILGIGIGILLKIKKKF